MKILPLTVLLFTTIHTAIGAPLAVGHPHMDFLEPRTFDFGKVTQGEQVSHRFKFKNTGDAVVGWGTVHQTRLLSVGGRICL